MHPDRHAPLPDTFPKAIWAFLMENAHWVCITLSVASIIVLIVPQMLNTQRKAYDTVALACARALQAELATEPFRQTTPARLRQESIQAACNQPTLQITPLQQPSAYAVQDSRGKRTFIVTPTALNSKP